MTIKQRVKIICETEGINLGYVANEMGMSQSTFSARLKTDKFTKKELKRIAEILNCEYVSYFKFDDGTIISELSVGEEIKVACKRAKVTMTELSRKMGVSQPAICKRLKTGKFTHEELENIAMMIDCEYHSAFMCKDGLTI